MVFIVVPAYNEAKHIGRVIRGLFEHGWRNVVVVDDGSSDDTASAARAAGATVLCHAINRGQGAALQTGNEYVLSRGARWIVHFDGDGQFNPRDIGAAVAIIEDKEVEAVLGSRFLDNRSKIPWVKKYFILPAARLVNYFLTGLKLTDAHNGFRILSRAAAEKITITQDGMAHNSEIPYQIRKQNISYVECPVEVLYFESGQGVIGGFKIVKDYIVGRMIR